jgi:hypothetical protein
MQPRSTRRRIRPTQPRECPGGHAPHPHRRARRLRDPVLAPGPGGGRGLGDARMRQTRVPRVDLGCDLSIRILPKNAAIALKPKRLRTNLSTR